MVIETRKRWVIVVAIASCSVVMDSAYLLIDS